MASAYGYKHRYHKSHIQLKLKHKHHHKHQLKHKALMKEDDKPTPIPYRLPDGNRDGFCEFSEFVAAFKNKEMTHGEIRAIFKVTDKNNDNKIDGNEWNAFHTIFV